MGEISVNVARLLHERGREVLPSEVEEWLSETAIKWNKRNPIIVSGDDIAKAVLAGNSTLTMCLHLRFGDALTGASDG